MTTTSLSGILAQQSLLQTGLAQGAIRRQAQAEKAIVGIIEKAAETGAHAQRGQNLDILL